VTAKATVPARDLAPGLSAAELDDRAAECYRHAGRWLAATFDLDLIVHRRDAFAHAERWAARGLQAERQARRERRITGESPGQADNG
jgi:hypothetical protein